MTTMTALVADYENRLRVCKSASLKNIPVEPSHLRIMLDALKVVARKAKPRVRVKAITETA